MKSAAIIGFLHRPKLILAICLGGVTAHLVYEGTLLQLWSLQNTRKELDSRIERNRMGLEQSLSQLKAAQKLEFIERRAHDQLELVQEGELLFVFSENANETR